MYSVLWFWTLTHTLTFWARAVCARGQFGPEEKKNPSYFIARPVLMETPKQQMIWNWLTVSHVYKRAFFRESRADSYPVAIYLFLRWEKIGVWLKRAGTHGKGQRKNSDSKPCRSFFLKSNGTFLEFFVLKILCGVYFFIFINKNVFSMEQKVFLCLLWRFSRFACMVLARQDSRESTVDYFDSSFRELWFDGW